MEWAGFATVVAVQITTIIWMATQFIAVRKEIAGIQGVMSQMMLEHLRLDHGKESKQ